MRKIERPVNAHLKGAAKIRMVGAFRQLKLMKRLASCTGHHGRSARYRRASQSKQAVFQSSMNFAWRCSKNSIAGRFQASYVHHYSKTTFLKGFHKRRYETRIVF
jgi:hypothetical protein